MKKIIALVLSMGMFASVFTACSGKSDSETTSTKESSKTEDSVTITESTTEESTQESTLESTMEVTEETGSSDTDATSTSDVTSATDATTSETTAEPTETTRIVTADGWPSFEMPSQDTTYIDKLIDAGIAPEYYRGTYINFTVEESGDKPGDMIIYFVNNNPDPNAKIYDFTDAGDGLSEADAKTVDDLVRESFYCYFDYYENYDGRKAIDLDGDGNISYIEMNICAYFTSGAEFRGLMIDQIN